MSDQQEANDRSLPLPMNDLFELSLCGFLIADTSGKIIHSEEICIDG